MGKRLLRLISMLLAVVITLNLLPLNIIAEEIRDHAASTTMPNSSEPAEIVAEITDKRTEFSKEYKLSNGLNMAVVYPDAVN